MMKKYIFLLLIMLSNSIASQNLKSYFISMPDSIIPLLTKVNREDCVDFLDSKMKAEVKNKFGNISELKALTDNYLLLQTTSNSYIEMRLLSVNDSTKIIGVSRSYKAKAVDSSLSFYSTDWHRLDNMKFINLPAREKSALNDSLSFKDLTSQEINDIMDIPLMKISFQEINNDLIFENTSPYTLDKEQLMELKLDRQNKTIRYIWKDGRYVLEK
jgi:hypothetical protein